VSDLVAIARVAKPRGLKGELVADLLTDFPERFDGLENVTGVFANGGGGGSASPGASACAGPLAEDGKASLVPAAGSSCATGAGGAGAAGSIAATAGESTLADGGGGGGLGRIVVRTLATQTPTIGSTRLSPAPGSSAFQIVKTLN